MFRFEPYQPADQAEWDDFVRVSRNGVFLFERGYMDYHADRFRDASIVVRSTEGAGMVAVLPAHRVDVAGKHHLVSHGGLTFGGLVMHPKLGGAEVLAMLGAMIDWLRQRGVTRLVYRPVPHIYHRLPSEDDLYALHRLGAKPSSMQLSSTLDLHQDVPPSSHRRRQAAVAAKAGVVAASSSADAFWPLLAQTLQRRHGVDPVHSLAEIRLLASRFAQIDVIGAHFAHHGAADLLAGAVLYQYDGVTHTQYLASSETGYQVAAMNVVIEHAIQIARQRGSRWLSFGTSTHEGGRALNEGLLRYKERFGARSTVLQGHEIEIGERQA